MCSFIPSTSCYHPFFWHTLSMDTCFLFDILFTFVKDGWSLTISGRYRSMAYLWKFRWFNKKKTVSRKPVLVKPSPALTRPGHPTPHFRFTLFFSPPPPSSFTLFAPRLQFYTICPLHSSFTLVVTSTPVLHSASSILHYLPPPPQFYTS